MNPFNIVQRWFAVAIAVCVLSGVMGSARAAIPYLLNYQGFLTNPSTGAPVNAPSGSPLSMTFNLYTAATGGTAVYSETQSVVVTNGNFNVQIGSITPLSGLPFNTPYWLEITVGSSTLTPREAVGSSAYAIHAAVADALVPVPGTGAGNTSLGGSGALGLNTTGAGNTAGGSLAMLNNTSGTQNTALGDQALYSNTTGSYNTAVGFDVLQGNSTGQYNVAVGFQALAFSTGTDNIAIGANAGINLTTGNNNVDIFNNGVAGESGIIRIGTAGFQTATYLTGNVFSNGVFTNTSDVNQKTDFEAVDADTVLQKVMAVPVQTWRYKDDQQKVRHIGPMAQDFYSAFEVGVDNRHIATVDAEGVSLVAIQALNARLEATQKALEQTIAARDVEAAALRARTSALEAEVAAQRLAATSMREDIAELRRSVDQMLAASGPAGGKVRAAPDDPRPAGWLRPGAAVAEAGGAR